MHCLPPVLMPYKPSFRGTPTCSNFCTTGPASWDCCCRQSSKGNAPAGARGEGLYRAGEHSITTSNMHSYRSK